MAENLRFLRTLQIISETARKINPSARPIHKISNTTTILKSLPEHRSLLPILLSHDIPSKLAKACADRYDKYASELRSRTESKLTPYLINRDGGQPARVYAVFLKNYKQALRNWSQTVLNTVLKSLKRDSVQLHDWEVAYPPPLWLPSAADTYPKFTPQAPQKSCPISSTCAPHAFPTPYPPPLRPPSGISPVKWLRTPAAPSSFPSTSTIDLDSLCLQFTKSLVIDENPVQLLQPKTSIFSLPTVSKGHTSCCLRARLPKKHHSKTQRSQDLLTLKPTAATSPLNATMPRQLSIPPSFPSSPLKIKTTPRKASAPTRFSASKHGTVSPKRSDSAFHLTSETLKSPLNSTGGRLDVLSRLGSDPSPLSPQPPLYLTLDQTTHTLQILSGSLAGPATPPALLPGLFAEPVVAPSTPVHLSPGSSLASIADPFLHFQPQYDYFSDHSLASALDYSGLIPGVTTDGFSSKRAFDTPLGPNHPSYGIPIPITSGPLENDFFNAYPVF